MTINCRESAFAVLYSHAYLEVAGSWPQRGVAFGGDFTADEAVLAKLPTKVADEIRDSLDRTKNRSPAATLRQEIRSSFVNAELAAQRRSLAALRDALIGKTVSNHPAALLAQVPKKIVISEQQAALVCELAQRLRHAEPNERPVLPDQEAAAGQPTTLVSGASLPPDVAVRGNELGLYIDQLFVGPVPPDELPQASTSQLNPLAIEALRAFVLERVPTQGTGHWRLARPPVASTEQLTPISIDPPDLLGGLQREAHVLDGHLYVTLPDSSAGGNPRPLCWYYLGPVPQALERVVVEKPVLGGTDEALTYLANHPDPPPPPPVYATAVGGYGELSPALEQFMHDAYRWKPDLNGHGELLRSLIDQMKLQGLHTASLFLTRREEPAHNLGKDLDLALRYLSALIEPWGQTASAIRNVQNSGYVWDDFDKGRKAGLFKGTVEQSRTEVRAALGFAADQNPSLSMVEFSIDGDVPKFKIETGTLDIAAPPSTTPPIA